MGSVSHKTETVEKAPMMMREEAFITLERMIVTGSLAPGEWVSETQLVEISGHSRASVRAALQRLQDQELIQIVPRRGAQVCTIDYKRQFRALELRRAVEALLARSAAVRADAAQRAEFTAIAVGLAKVSQSLNHDRMRELDLRSHNLLMAAADNPYGAKALSSVKGLSRRFWLLHHEEYGDIPRMATSLAGVAQAIGAADADAAGAAVHVTLDYVEELTLKVVGYQK